MVYKSLPFILIFMASGCFGAAEQSLAQIRQEALKLRTEKAWREACTENNLGKMEELRDQVIALKIEAKSEVDSLMEVLRETSPEVVQERAQKEAQRHELITSWKNAFAKKDLAALDALATPVVQENIVSKKDAAKVLQGATECCAREDHYLGAEQQEEKVENPLHAVYLGRLQTAHDDQERAAILLEAFKQFVADDSSENYQRIVNLLDTQAHELNSAKITQLASALMTVPFSTCIKGQLDLECSLLSIFGRYGIWCPRVNKNKVTIATAIRWLKQLIKQTNEKGKSVEPIINLCHDKLCEKPVAFNVAAACLYEQLVRPLQLRKRTNVIVQLNDAQLFDGTPYFHAVAEAALPEPEDLAPASAPAGFIDDAPLSRSAEQEELGAQLLGLLEQALDTGNIETALEYREPLIATGMPAHVFDAKIKEAESAMTPPPAFHDDAEGVEDALDASVAELSVLFYRALDNRDADLLRGLFPQIVANLGISEEQLQTRIAEIESLKDLPSADRGFAAVAPAPAVPANTGWRAWAGNVFANAGSIVTNNPTKSALVAGALASLAWIARR